MSAVLVPDITAEAPVARGEKEVVIQPSLWFAIEMNCYFTNEPQSPQFVIRRIPEAERW
jgi:hypothetical protein